MPTDPQEPKSADQRADDREWFLACAEYIKIEPLYYSALPEVRAAIDDYLRARAEGKNASTEGISLEMVRTLEAMIERARGLLRNWPRH